MARLLHGGGAEDSYRPAKALQFRAARKAAAAHLAGREEMGTTVEAAVHNQVGARGGGEEVGATVEAALTRRRVAPGVSPDRPHRRPDRSNGSRGRFPHVASLETTSVGCVEKIPPFPDTSATSCFGTCRAPPSP